jgi:hypothetical protein
MSCLFDSLSHFLKDIDSAGLRNIVCDNLETNPVILDNIHANEITNWESDISLEQYVKKMRLYNTWGGATEIKCFCQLLNVIVIVHYNSRQINFIPENVSPRCIINISYNGSHFTPLKINSL